MKNKFLILFLIGSLDHPLLASTPSSPPIESNDSPLIQPVGSIGDLINYATAGNLQFCCDIFDSDKLYKSPKNESSIEGVINNSSNLTIDGNGYCFCLSEVCVESSNNVPPCFINSANDLTLKNFSRIKCDTSSQVMNTTGSSVQASFLNAKNVSIINNIVVDFTNSNSFSSGNYWQPGIIRAFGSNNSPGQLTIQDNGSVIFKNNQNKQRGSISGNNISLVGNQSVLFENNYSMGEGGAIACINISNQIPQVMIANNQDVLFRNNFGVYGGAFTCYNKLDFQNNGLVIFDNNRASTSGGAIHLHKSNTGSDHSFTIKGNKSLIFSRNISPIGPAVCLNSNRELLLSLFANEGDITFLQNIKTDSSYQPLQCCSLQLKGNNQSNTGKLRHLCASEGYSINFYDPIVYDAEIVGSEEHDILINGAQNSGVDHSETGGEYSGTIFFSASQIPNFLKQNSEKYDKSRTTRLPTRVYLKNGSLAIDKNTVLICRIFSQDAGVLSIGANGKIQIEGFTKINNVLIDLDSFDQISSQNSTPVLIQTNARINDGVYFSGEIDFKTPNYFAFYNSFVIGSSLKIPILEISAPNNPPDGTNGFTLKKTYLHITPPTGYSGNLTFEWDNRGDAPQPTTLPATLYATWTPTGYNCAPYFKTPTFLNTAWMGVAAAKAISSPLLPEKNSPFKHGLAGLSVDALISSLNIRPSRGDENLHFTGNGYSLGCFLGDAFSSLEIRFGKLDGQAFNQKFNEEVNSSYYLGNICSRGSTFKTPVGEVHSALSLSYAYGRNNIYASFSEDFFGRRLSFHSRNFLAELLLSKPLTGHGLSPLLRSASPFIKASFSLSKNPGCQEVELTKDVITRQILVPVHSFVQKLMIPPPARLRQYLPSTLYNLSISPGISSESISQWNIFPVALRVSAAFSVDPYRVNPKTTMMIIQNAFPIPIRGTSLARCSAEVASSFQIKLLPGLTSYVDYKGNFSTRNISNSLKLGSSLIF
ncbi:polymorphic outer membrane protein middle domain-containing protein [Chlamydiifrater volucris]|uniref:polymorphic outer membrane protein middle domain-containing protein n=1 Tax=Chlamydiifrater volucris TaxID=2681470 RepID=UPI001BCFF56D|nr:polymorphic outer membrane protein middle domain-containing protein [Chlamydiifrater volucris]